MSVDVAAILGNKKKRRSFQQSKTKRKYSRRNPEREKTINNWKLRNKPKRISLPRTKPTHILIIGTFRHQPNFKIQNFGMQYINNKIMTLPEFFDNRYL